MSTSKEEIFLVVLLQPLDGRHERARSVAVRLVPPRSADVQGLIVVARLGEQGPQGVLPSVHEERLETPVVVHPVSQVVGGIDRGRRVKSPPYQHLREGRHVPWKGLPPHEGHSPAARLVVRPCGHGGEPGRVVPVEAYRPGRQRIKVWRANGRIAVGADVVPAECIAHDPDDVQGIFSKGGVRSSIYHKRRRLR